MKIIFVLGILAAMANGSAFRPRNAITLNKNILKGPLLDLRAGDGGEIPLPTPLPQSKSFDLRDPGHLFVAAYLIQGSLFSLFPGQQANFYNWWEPENSEEALALTEMLGLAVLARGVASYCAQIKDMEALTSLGYCAAACIPWAVRGYLTNSYLKAGVGNAKFAHLVVVNLFYMAVAFAGTSWAPAILKTMMVIYIVMALQGIFFPKAFMASWCNDQLPEWRTLFLVKGFSYFLLGLEIHNLLILAGTEPAKAMAYSSIPCLYHFLYSLFVSREATEAGRPTGYLFWAVFFSYCITSILVK